MLKLLFRALGLSICLLICIHTYAQRSDIKPVLDKARNFINNGQADSALVYVDKALILAGKYNDTPSLIRALGIKGKSLFSQKKSKEAVNLYFDALRLCKSPADDKQTAFLYSEIGYAYYTQEHYLEARVYYNKELAIRKTIKQDKEVCNALINIAACSRHQKDYDTAFKALDEIKEILAVWPDTATQGYYYINRGVLFETKGDLDSAAYCYHKAYDIWLQLRKESEIFKATFNLGFIEAERKNYSEALKYYHLSEAAAKKYGSGHEVAHVYGTIAEAYAAENNYKDAYDYLHQYATLNDSLSKIDFNTYIIKLDKQFETQKNKETIQEQELKLQKQKNTILYVILASIALLFIAVVLFSYLTFRSRLRKKVEEAKGRFFSNVAHEIRTPLSMIQGPIKILQSKVDDPALNHQLDIAERNTQRLNDLIGQMLAISKIDTSKYKLNESIGNLADFFDEIIKQYQSLADEKHLAFTSQVEINTGTAIFDKDVLEKITGNLLSNAIKYTPQNKAIGIEVLTEASEEGVNLNINVWDTGQGIAKNEQAKIFERFYRSPQQEGNKTKGIGIGLALVKELAALMNGTVTVESEPGKGATFTVRLFLKQAPIVDAIESNMFNEQPIILLVEDDKDILDFNKILLKEKGYNVITATNGNEAAELLSHQLPDLIITDLMMPGQNGIDLIKNIRANPQTDHIPVIILSAKSSMQSKLEGMEEGAQVYLSKPFNPNELVALVNNQLQILSRQRSYYQQEVAKEDKSIEERFSGSDPFTRKCYLLINEHLNDAQLSVEKLAELMNINRSHFQRKIKTLTGYSPSELIRTIRLEKAKEMLLRKEGNITEIAYSTGFTSQSYFTKCFSEHFGYPPSQAANS